MLALTPDPSLLTSFLSDIDWRIVAVVAVGIAVWRRADIAAAVSMISERVSRGGAKARRGAELGLAAPEIYATQEDPVDGLLLGVQQRRDEIVGELKVLKARLAELERQLARIDGLFDKKTVSIGIPVEGAQ